MIPRRWHRGDVCMVERTGAESGPRKLVCIVMDADDPKVDGPVAKLCSVYPAVLQNEFWCGLQDLVTAPASTLRRAMQALDREAIEIGRQKALVAFELERRKSARLRR